MPEVRGKNQNKQTKKTPTPLHALSLRTKEKSYAVEGTENVFARLETMMKSFLKGNIGFNSGVKRLCLQIGTFYTGNSFSFSNNSAALFQVL